jgi:hypothetical protein
MGYRIRNSIRAPQHSRTPDHLEDEIKIGRIGDPQGLIPGLDKIILTNVF